MKRLLLLAVPLALAGCSSSGQTAGPLPSISLVSPGSSGTPSASPSTSASASAGACKNASVTAAVKSALETADGSTAPEVGGTTFYGVCGDTAYAVTTFATTPVFFTQQNGGAWQKVGTADAGCSSFTQAPDALRAIWGNCPVSVASPTPSATQSATPSAASTASCAAFYAGKTFAIFSSVMPTPGGGATVTATPATVHCGGPDDMQYVPGSSTVQLTIAANATISVEQEDNLPNTQQTDIAGLQRSVAKNVDGNTFEIVGPATGLTSVQQVYRP